MAQAPILSTIAATGAPDTADVIARRRTMMTRIVHVTCVVLDGSTPDDGTLSRWPTEQPITWPIGDEGEIHLSVITQDGGAFDLTGYTLSIVCRHHLADASPAFAVDAVNDPTPTSPAGPAPGTAVATLESADTSAMVAGVVYLYDVRVTDGTNSQQVCPMSKWTPGPVVARPGEPPEEETP
jgi:hypothetical protein